MKGPRLIGETTITGKNQISLPAQGMRMLGWGRGDRLLVEVLDDDFVVLIRRPRSYTDSYAGRLSDLFGSPEDTLRYLEAERKSWEATE